jgi:hypothetical protein
MSCDHCSHPLWAGIRCSVCGRWADEPSEALKQTWADYQDALKRFDCPRCGHCCSQPEQEPVALCDPAEYDDFQGAVSRNQIASRQK